MLSTRRRIQLWMAYDRLAAMHQALRWEQKGPVGEMVAKGRARIERLTEKIFQRLAH